MTSLHVHGRILHVAVNPNLDKRQGNSCPKQCCHEKKRSLTIISSCSLIMCASWEKIPPNSTMVLSMFCIASARDCRYSSVWSVIRAICQRRTCVHSQAKCVKVDPVTCWLESAPKEMATSPLFICCSCLSSSSADAANTDPAWKPFTADCGSDDVTCPWENIS